MKKIILLILIISLASCSKNEQEELGYRNNFIDNEGYIPVSPNNTWLYDMWQANLSDDGSYEYEGNPTSITSTITDVKYDEKNKQITYDFSPFPIKIIGDMLGNTNKVKKIGDKYYRDAVFDLSNNSLAFNSSLNGALFIDESSKVGNLLHTEAQTHQSNLLTPVKTKYSLKTYFTGKYDKLPSYLTNKEGIDSHLAQYSDIIKITDSLIIDELIFSVNSLNLVLDLEAFQAGSGSQNIGPSPDIELTGTVQIKPFPFFPGSIPITLRPGGSELLETVIKINALGLPFCESITKINQNHMIDLDFKIISNDIPLVIDYYYAKGVGKIKTVVNVEQINGVVKFDEFSTKPFIFRTTSTPINQLCQTDPEEFFNDPNKKGSYTTELDLKAVLDGLFIKIPFSGGIKTDLVQNLKAHVLRKSLN